MVGRQGSIASLSEADVIRAHGYLNFPGLCRSASQALAELCAEQRAALAEPAIAVPGPAG